MITDPTRARADAILARRTDRLPFAAPARWEFIEPVVRDAVDPETATLRVLPDSVRLQLAEASRLTLGFRTRPGGCRPQLSAERPGHHWAAARHCRLFCWKPPLPDWPPAR